MHNQYFENKEHLFSLLASISLLGDIVKFYLS